MFAIEPHESGRRIRRGYVVALGLVAGFALYGKYEARKPAAFTQHWPDRWSLVSHACTPLDVDAQVHQFEGGLDEMMCYAAAGRFAQVRELLGVPGMPSVGALVVEAHIAAHRGDRRAEAVLAEFGGAEAREHAGLAAYHAGDDEAATRLLTGTDVDGQVAIALRDMFLHTPVAEREARCGMASIEIQMAIDEWQTCREPHAHCAIQPPPHPWLVARAACTAAATIPMAGLDRVDPSLCDAAAGRLSALAELSQDDATDLLGLLEPFLAEDVRARDAFDMLAKRDWRREDIAVRLAALAAGICHVAVANDLLAQKPDNMFTSVWADREAARVRDKLAQCR